MNSKSEKKSTSYEGLARRYRPQTFDDVIGQPHIVKTLKKAIEKKQISHAYLFIGGRGLGKTTMARILAKALNCESGPTVEPCGTCDSCLDIARSSHIDVLELDAASNTGVDNVRETIIQAVVTVPAKAKYKIFIIDETHMLSAQAFAALLKTIEEPPAHVVFILATTEGYKVPAPIRSRCQRFDFRPVSSNELTNRLKEIADNESISIDNDALQLIVDYSEGGVRDALSSLDLVRTYCADKITVAKAEEALGIIPSITTKKLIDAIRIGDIDSAEKMLEEVWNMGADSNEILRALLLAFRKELLNEVRGQKNILSRGRIVKSIETILSTMDRARYSRHPLIELEILMSKLCTFSNEKTSLEKIYELLLKISGSAPENKIQKEVINESHTITIKKPEKRIEQSRQNDMKTLLSLFKRDEFMKELNAIAPSALQFCSDSVLSIPEPGILKLILPSKELYDKLEKDRKAQSDIKKAAELIYADKFKLLFEFKDVSHKSTLPVQNELDLTDSNKNKKSKNSDPDIERIKKLFGAEEVDIIDD